MIKGMGIDIVELKRMKKIMDRQTRLMERILTKEEQELFYSFSSEKRKLEFLAGRFAAKEAFSKAKGTGLGKLSFLDIEILPNHNGAPYVTSPVLAQEKSFVSISHSEQYAIAQVIIESNSAY